LRTLTNALLSALLFCFWLALLVLDLNINLPFSAGFFLTLGIDLMMTYGLLVALFVVAVQSAFRFISGRKSKPAFVAPSFLVLSTSILTLLALVIIRENTAYFAAFFVPGFQSALKAQIIALFVLAVCGLVIHFLYHHRRPLRWTFAVYFGLLGGVLGFTIWQRLVFPSPRRPLRTAVQKAPLIDKRVTLLGLNGLTLDFILPLAAEGKLPNFTTLMDGGSWGRLESFTPNDPFVLRHTVNTGKYPGKHRLISDIRYSLPGLERRLEVVPRFIFFRQFTRLGLLRSEANDAPPQVKDLWKIASEFGLPALAFDVPPPDDAPLPPDIRLEKQFGAAFKDFQFDTPGPYDRLHDAFLRDAVFEEAAFRLKGEKAPRVYSLVLDGLNVVESLFYKYSVPETFGEIKQDEIQKYGPVIRHYYQFYDQIIGKYMAAMKDDELLIVYSAHGIEPLPFWKRLIEWLLGNAAVSAYHEQAPDGVVFFFGRGVEHGRNLNAIKLVDILPSVLYSMRLPVAKDMDGIVRGSIFTREFTEDNPVFTITSYEDMEVRPAEPRAPEKKPADKSDRTAPQR
jgi:hypothetical protein